MQGTIANCTIRNRERYDRAVEEDTERRQPQNSWPFESSRLERIAFRAGISDDELREWLRGQVDARLRATAPKTLKVKRPCSECGQTFEVSERRAKEQTRCDDCRFPLTLAPTAQELAWAAAQPPDIRDAVEAFLRQGDG